METGSAASLKAAQEAAAKVNAMLVASGQLKLSELSKRNKNNKSNDLFIDEVVINDTPMSARNFLTRSSTQEEISKMSGAAVSTRGRYMSPEERKTAGKKPIDRPLYLHIQAVNQQDVKVAVGRIMHIIMEHSHRRAQGMQRPRGPRPNPAPGLMGPRPGSGPRGPRPLVFRPSRPDMSAPPPQTQPPPPVANILREKVFLPVNLGIPPADIRLRLVGENGMNLRYIGEETGVAISLRGIGSGYQEPNTGQEAQDSLHFYLEHDNQEKFNEAKDLVVNLAQTVIAEIQQEIQQQQQQQQQHHHPQHHHQEHQQQLQQPAPLFSQPPPQQPDVALGAGGGMGQPHLTPVQMAPHQLAVPQAPPPQIIHSQIVTPQVPPHSQIVPPHVAHTQVGPGQVALQGQVGGGQVSGGVLHPGLAPHLGSGAAGEVLQQPEVIQASVVSLPQVVHLAPPSVVSTAPTVPSQQLVHTSSGTQLVTLPPGTQIVNTPEGPRLVALAAGTPGQVAGPVAQLPAAPQPHPGSMPDHQALSGSLVQQQQQQQHQHQHQHQQQPAPQSLPASVTNAHLAINQPPGYADPSAQPSSMATPPAPPTSYPSQAIANSVSSANPLTNTVLNGSHDTTYPPTVNSSLPPPNNTPALGMPPPGPTLGLTPVVSSHTGTVSFVVTPGVNTVTTTSGVGLLVPHDPNAPAQLHTAQPVVVTGVMQPSQQHQQHNPHPSSQTPTPSYVGAIPQQPLGPTGYPASQPPVEQPVSSAYLPSDQGYNGPVTSTATQHYTQQQQQQNQQQQQHQQRPVGMTYPNAPADHPPSARLEVAGPGVPDTTGGPGVPGVMPPQLPMHNMQRPQGQKVEQSQPHLHPGPAYYTPRPGPQEPRPGVTLEQQWQQFQQQVKMEAGAGAGSGQQQYDPYAASDDTEHHDAPPRHTQANSGIPAQQQPVYSQGQQLSQLAVPQQPSTHPQQMQQPPDTRDGENRSPNSLGKGNMKSGGRASPHYSYAYYYRSQQGLGPQPQTQVQHRLGPPSPDRGDHHTQQQVTDPRYQPQPSNTPLDVSPQRSSPQSHTSHPQGQPGYLQGPYQGQSPQCNPEGGPQHEDQYPHSKAGETVGSVYSQQVASQMTQHHQSAPQQGQSIPQQQLMAPQELAESQLQQGSTHQSQQFPSEQYPPGGQYPWAQYPQPSNGSASLTSGPATFGNGPVPYSNGPVSLSAPSGPSVPSSYALVGGSGSGPYQSGAGGHCGRYPNGQNSPFPVAAEERQPVFPDKKAEPGVGRDMTASLLMPPPPPPPPSELPGNVRGREESPDSGMLKRQGSCSPKDENAVKRPREDSDETGGPEGRDGRRDSPGGPYPGPANYQGDSSRYPTGRGSFMGPGGRGPWERWAGPMQGPYSSMHMGPGPFSRAHAGARNPRDRLDLDDCGSGRRAGRGGSSRGGFGMGSRGVRDRRW